MRYEIQNYLPEQYKHSVNLIDYFDSINLQYDDIERVLTEIEAKTGLWTANGRNLDDVGDIVGIKRPYASDLSRYFSYLGGAGKGFTDVYGSVSGGEWRTLYDNESFLVGDEIYRELILLKIFVNNSYGRPEDILYAVREYTNTNAQLIEDTSTPAHFDLYILGASDIDKQNFYEHYLTRPIGVSITVHNLPLPGQSVYFDSYTGTGAEQTIVISGANFEYGYMLWVKAYDNTTSNFIYSTLLGATKCFEVDKENSFTDAGMVSLNNDGFTVGVSDAINKNAIRYEYFIIPFTRAEEFENSDGRAVKWAINDYTGFANAVYEGSGEPENILVTPYNEIPKLVAFKDLTNGGDFSVISPSFNESAFKMNTNEDSYFDEELPSLVRKQIHLKTMYNNSNSFNFIWSVSKGLGYSFIDTYVGNGTDAHLISLGYRPSIVMIKRVDGVGSWIYLTDNFIVGDTLKADTSDAVVSDGKITIEDFGFSLSTNEEVNRDGAKYFYFAVKQ